MSSSAIIELKDVSFSYGGPPALEAVTLSVQRGEFLGVVGPNAGGKSTLLKLILGLLKPIRGTVRIDGQAPEATRDEIGYVPQYPRFARDFPITVEQAVLMGRLGKTRWWGGYRREDKRIAMRSLKETETADLARRRLDTLSGGQLQRVLLSRALASDPKVLILDEPTSNIDQRVETDIFDLLKQLNQRMTIVVVSHDIAFISYYVDRVACLNRSLICHDTAHIDGKLIDELYGAHMHAVEHRH
ncbi:MAG TPA: ABC transporter ATP-binding protein [Gammaproteobacteria bacterium]|nr:ABC transporter ATP-binding protein [Gammaproteobacteria bacterium]